MVGEWDRSYMRIWVEWGQGTRPEMVGRSLLGMRREVKISRERRMCEKIVQIRRKQDSFTVCQTPALMDSFFAALLSRDPAPSKRKTVWLNSRWVKVSFFSLKGHVTSEELDPSIFRKEVAHVWVTAPCEALCLARNSCVSQVVLLPLQKSGSRLRDV